jgi:alpha-2-macroglobulin
VGADGTVKVEIDTAIAKAIHGDLDHQYSISADITDASRRTVTGSGNVMVARKAFKVYSWVDKGYYRTGDVIEASFKAQTLDNKGVQGKGELKLLKITYDKEMKPTETAVQTWNLDTDEQGESRQQMKAADPGQYRLSYAVTDKQNHRIEGGYVFTVRGPDFNGKEYRFNDIELITQKREYRDGEKIELMINTNRSDATVALFVRPVNGVYLPPKIVRMKGKSTVETIDVTKKDMPNFFVEAFTISDGKLYDETKEVVVPPESRILNVEVTSAKKSYKPGEKTKVQVKLTDPTGEPFVGSTVISVYDKAVEYISGGSNVADIKEFFWKWRRTHQPRTEISLSKGGQNLTRPKEVTMKFLGAFGAMVADLEQSTTGGLKQAERRNRAQEAETALSMDGAFGGGGGIGGAAFSRAPAAPMAARGMSLRKAAAGFEDATLAVADAKGGGEFDRNGADKPGDGGGGAGNAPVEPSIRKNFADTALWVANVNTNANGVAEFDLTLPENLTTWKSKVWAMGGGTQVGSGDLDLITTKDLIVRLQAPRFFVQKDEVVLSANVHNYLKNKKTVKVSLDLQGGTLRGVGEPDEMSKQNPGGNTLTYNVSVDVDPKGEKRVDFRVKVLKPGEATVRMKAVTDEDSDAMEMKFPVYVHGMLKTDSFSGAMKPDQGAANLTFAVPNERNPAFSRLEVRYSPTLAMAMIDALPYLVDYPYGSTENTLNRFVPTVVTQKVLLDMKLDLADIRAKRTNLNAQEIGDDAGRAAGWKRYDRNPVFDQAEVASMVKDGVAKLTAMQLNDGGWGWFSGWGEQSWPHTTAVVVHGLQTAKTNDAALVPGVMERGVQWLVNYQNVEVQKLQNAPSKTRPWKDKADNLDALVYMVLVDAGNDNRAMRDFLYRDRNDLAVYSKAMVALACHKINDFEKRDMLIKNVDQYLVQDAENQTAYLKLPENNYWWCWYGSDTEAMGYYLKLLALTDAKSDKASGLAKYLVNNRKHATYWNSTRDTAIVIEALADFIRASGEAKPELNLEILVDGKSMKTVSISAANLFSYDNKLVMTGDALAAGNHKVEFKKTGNSPLYYNAYATNFTMEDSITKAGLEIKVERKYYKLTEIDKKISVSGSRGQAVKQKVEKYRRDELRDGDTLKSGDLVEVELEIASKNDYEYVMFEDMKPAGFEPVEVRGYNGNDMNAYVEFRDERVAFFVRALAREKHSVSYRMRAEIPGKFSALPTKASAIYAPELKANADEIKLNVKD